MRQFFSIARTATKTNDFETFVDCAHLSGWATCFDLGRSPGCLEGLPSFPHRASFPSISASNRERMTSPWTRRPEPTKRCLEPFDWPELAADFAPRSASDRAFQ